VDAYHAPAPDGAQTGKGRDGAEWGLGELIEHVALIGGIDRLRFTTSHPRDMDDALIAVLAREKKLMPYLHLPIQAGSNKVLHAMNRGHTYDDYKTLIAKIRAVRPDIALSGDFIVGFPGETEADFEQTMKCVDASKRLVMRVALVSNIPSAPEPPARASRAKCQKT